MAIISAPYTKQGHQNYDKIIWSKKGNIAPNMRNKWKPLEGRKKDEVWRERELLKTEIKDRMIPRNMCDKDDGLYGYNTNEMLRREMNPNTTTLVERYRNLSKRLGEHKTEYKTERLRRMR